MPRGRRPTPTARLKATGTYRADRHGTRSDSLPPSRPSRPRDLPKDAAKLWSVLLPWLEKHGTIQTIDGSMLEMLCRFWALARVAMAEAEADPCDKAKRTAAVAYSTVFERLGAKFGLTPADRTKLSLQADSTPTDPKERFFKVVTA